jgi:hypothetical protein
MNEPDLELFERELRTLLPAAPPPDFMARLAGAQPCPAPVGASPRTAPLTSPGAGRFFRWPFLLWWLSPAAALVLAVGLVWHHNVARRAVVAPRSVLKADSVRLDQQLVGTFDAVGRLPDGEPVRFQYQKWMDQLVVKDETSGVVIQQRTPRVEVIPVGYETY